MPKLEWSLFSSFKINAPALLAEIITSSLFDGKLKDSSFLNTVDIKMFSSLSLISIQTSSFAIICFKKFE